MALGATLDGVVAQRIAGVGLQLAVGAAPHRHCFVHASHGADLAHARRLRDALDGELAQRHEARHAAVEIDKRAGGDEARGDDRLLVGVDVARPRAADADADADADAPADDTLHVVATLPRVHLSDTRNESPNELPPVGASLGELVVLRVDGERRVTRVLVSHKPSLVAAGARWPRRQPRSFFAFVTDRGPTARAGELPTSVADAIVGRVYAAHVTSVTPHAVFVGFGGSVRCVRARARATRASVAAR